MQRLRTVTSLDFSAVAGHHAMPAALLYIYLKSTVATRQVRIMMQLFDLFDALACSKIFRNISMDILSTLTCQCHRHFAELFPFEIFSIEIMSTL